MKKLLLGLVVAIGLMMPTIEAATAYSHDVYVSGYTKKNGTYVKPHRRSKPNYTRNDNYTTRGNVNPYTGRAGTVRRDSGLGGLKPTRRVR